MLFALLGRQEAALDPYVHRWRFLPKHHLFVHCLEAMTDNVMRHWCYADEQAIGTATEVAAAVHPKTLSHAVMSRYRVSQLREA
jgi:hypothetical protein